MEYRNDEQVSELISEYLSQNSKCVQAEYDEEIRAEADLCHECCHCCRVMMI